MLQPMRTKFRKAHKGRIKGIATSGVDLAFGQFGLKALEPERVCTPDRGCASGAHAPHETGGPGLDSHLSRRPRVKEAARSAHGLWKGGSRAVGDPRQAGSNLV